MLKEESSQKSKIESSILWGKTQNKDKIRNFTPKEKYKKEYFLNNINWFWDRKVQKIVGGLAGDSERACDGENSGSNKGGRDIGL